MKNLTDVFNHLVRPMKHECEMIVDDNGIEINVGYDYEKTPPQIEEGHGLHDVGSLVYTKLTSVEVVISGVGVDILPMLNDTQKKHIISKLQY